MLLRCVLLRCCSHDLWGFGRLEALFHGLLAMPLFSCLWDLFSGGSSTAKPGPPVSYRFAQLTDVHIEPFYNPERGHLKGGVCRVPEAFNKSRCIPFEVEPEADAYPLGRLNCDPPVALLRSILEHMERVARTDKPDFVLFLSPPWKLLS